MKKLVKIICAVFAVLMIAVIPLSAAKPYQTYTYSISGTPLYSPNAYDPMVIVDHKYMGLGEALGENNEVIWHWFPRENKTAEEELTNAASTEIYISSVNGIAVTGEIVNIDGTCNRLASTLYGHKKVYFVIGENKIADTLDGAIYRARNIASPLNAKRLNKNTPCAKNKDENKCYNCSSPERICAALTVFWQRPKGQKYEIVLIRESL